MEEKFVRILAFDEQGEAHPVGLHVGRRRNATCPYRQWALVNLANEDLAGAIKGLNQTQGRLFLALLFSRNPLRLKDLASNVGAPTSQVCRAAKELVKAGLIEKSDGLYAIPRAIRWTGKWRASPRERE